MTGRGKAKVLLVLGLGALAFGAKLVKDQYDVYWPSDLPPTLAFYGGGLLAVSIALAILEKPWVGAVVFVLGAGAAGAVIKLGQIAMDKQTAVWEMERQVGDAAEKVCDGTPNAAASGTVRGVMQVTDTVGSEVKVPFKWEGFPVPATPAELHVVVCRTQDHNTVAVCDYSDSSGNNRYQITKYQIVDHLSVMDARTGALLGSDSFAGSVPSEKCDDAVSMRSDSRETSHEVGGDSPDHAAETAFIRPFVERAEN